MSLSSTPLLGVSNLTIDAALERLFQNQNSEATVLELAEKVATLNESEQKKLIKATFNSFKLFFDNYYKPSFPSALRDADREEMTYYLKPTQLSENFQIQNAHNFRQYFDGTTAEKEEHSDAERMIWLQKLADELAERTVGNPKKGILAEKSFATLARNALIFAIRYGSARACYQLITYSTNGVFSTALTQSQTTSLYLVQSKLYRELPEQNTAIGATVEKTRTAPRPDQNKAYWQALTQQRRTTKTPEEMDDQRVTVFNELKTLYAHQDQFLPALNQNRLGQFTQHIELGERNITEALFTPKEVELTEAQRQINQQRKRLEQELETNQNRIKENPIDTDEQFAARRVLLDGAQQKYNEAIAPVNAEQESLNRKKATFYQVKDTHSLRHYYIKLISALTRHAFQAELAQRETYTKEWEIATKAEKEAAAQAPKEHAEQRTHKKRGSLFGGTSFDKLSKEQQADILANDEQLTEIKNKATLLKTEKEDRLAKFDRHLTVNSQLSYRIQILFETILSDLRRFGATNNHYRGYITDALNEDRQLFEGKKYELPPTSYLRLSKEYLALIAIYRDAYKQTSTQTDKLFWELCKDNIYLNHTDSSAQGDILLTDKTLTPYMAEQESTAFSHMLKHDLLLMMYLIVDRAMPEVTEEKTVLSTAPQEQQKALRSAFLSAAEKQRDRLFQIGHETEHMGALPAPESIDGEMRDYAIVIRGLLGENGALTSMSSHDPEDNPLIRQLTAENERRVAAGDKPLNIDIDVVMTELKVAVRKTRNASRPSYIDAQALYNILAKLAPRGTLFSTLVRVEFMRRYLTLAFVGTLTMADLVKSKHVISIASEEAEEPRPEARPEIRAEAIQRQSQRLTGSKQNAEALQDAAGAASPDHVDTASEEDEESTEQNKGVNTPLPAPAAPYNTPTSAAPRKLPESPVVQLQPLTPAAPCNTPTSAALPNAQERPAEPPQPPAPNLTPEQAETEPSAEEFKAAMLARLGVGKPPAKDSNEPDSEATKAWKAKKAAAAQAKAQESSPPAMPEATNAKAASPSNSASFNTALLDLVSKQEPQNTGNDDSFFSSSAGSDDSDDSDDQAEEGYNKARKGYDTARNRSTLDRKLAELRSSLTGKPPPPPTAAPSMNNKAGTTGKLDMKKLGSVTAMFGAPKAAAAAPARNANEESAPGPKKLKVAGNAQFSNISGLFGQGGAMAKRVADNAPSCKKS